MKYICYKYIVNLKNRLFIFSKLKKFNLIKCKNTKIGGVNDTKGISGGEKRRLAFASEVKNLIIS